MTNARSATDPGPPALIVAGPTASGKSAAATVLASLVGGHVINADSMQVYRDLRIVSARPGPQEQARVAHHLYGHVDGADRYSAGRYARDAAPIIEALRRQGITPVICGGTGFYLKALTEGLSPLPDVSPAQVEAAARDWDSCAETARQELLRLDPPMERLDPHDRQRHVRALAVARATGTPLSAWQAIKPEPVVDAPFVAACLLPQRSELYARCDSRFSAMVAQGAVEEIRALLSRELPEDLPVMRALGVPELAAHVRGELSLDEASAAAQQETRRFAKRQMTWFRNQTDWPAFETPEALVEHLRRAV